MSVKVCLLCREGLVWVDINWMDNGECLDLIEKVRTSQLCSGHAHIITYLSVLMFP